MGAHWGGTGRARMIGLLADGNDAQAWSSPVGALVAAPIGPLIAVASSSVGQSQRLGRSAASTLFYCGEASPRSFQSVSIAHAGDGSGIFGHPQKNRRWGRSSA